ncbi:hypothetical protein L7F22_001296 [Adiantum nelumboides]|nr:hypothetical protein [Adiantum nelumboides]
MGRGLSVLCTSQGRPITIPPFVRRVEPLGKGGKGCNFQHWLEPNAHGFLLCRAALEICVVGVCSAIGLMVLGVSYRRLVLDDFEVDEGRSGPATREQMCYNQEFGGGAAIMKLGKHSSLKERSCRRSEIVYRGEARSTW